MLNESFNKNEDLLNKRLILCKSCPLYKVDSLLGEICNSKLYINTETNKTSTYPRKGYINGCNCSIHKKVKIIESKCPINKW